MPVNNGEKNYKDVILRIAALLFFSASMAAVFRAGSFCQSMRCNIPENSLVAGIPKELPRLEQNEFYKKVQKPEVLMAMNPTERDPEPPPAGRAHLTD
jgi:hypothetical protein